MGWDEAARLVRILRSDPSSAIAAAIEGWDHPISREALIGMDNYDLLALINSPKRKKPKPHPGRPFKRNRTKQIRGRNVTVSQSVVRAALREAGHTAPIPTKPALAS